MKTLFRLAYAAWFCVLLGQFGVWHFCAGLLMNTSQYQAKCDQANHETSELLEQLRQVAKNKIAKGLKYSCDDYFQDYLKAEKIFKKYNIGLIHGGIPLYQQMGNLWDLVPAASRDSIGCKWEAQNRALGFQQYNSAQLFSLQAIHNQEAVSDLGSGLGEIIKHPSIIVGYYLKYFFVFAFLLLLLDLRDRRLCLKSPLSFALNLLLYPVVLLREWWFMMVDKSREYYIEAQFRRRSGLWMIFSDNEVELIKKLVQGDLKLSEIKKKIVANHPHARHSLLVALGATILIHAVPIKLAITAIEVSAIVQLIQHEEGQVLKITHDGGGGAVKLFLDYDPGFLDNPTQPTSSKTIPESFWRQRFKIGKLSRKIDHIPLLTTKILNFSC